MQISTLAAGRSRSADTHAVEDWLVLRAGLGRALGWRKTSLNTQRASIRSGFLEKSSATSNLVSPYFGGIDPIMV
jgi:hypothetical protein